jgi:hypothetical protein
LESIEVINRKFKSNVEHLRRSTSAKNLEILGGQSLFAVRPKQADLKRQKNTP